MDRKGIILAGGSGTRLYPLTLATSKQLMPVYDKPMIYYPIYTLILAGIREILVITTPRDNEAFRNLLGDGSQWGISLSYKIQDEPRGLADAFIVGADFIGESNVVLILGDNLFYGESFEETLRSASARESEATIFGYKVSDPERYGIVEFDNAGNALSIEEKPEQPKSDYAIPGLYFFPKDVVEVARGVQPSARGELEITSVQNVFLEQGRLKVEKLGSGMAWFDTGTHDALIETASYVQTIENRQGRQICCPEEIAYTSGWISKEKLLEAAELLKKTKYGKFLFNLAEEK